MVNRLLAVETLAGLAAELGLELVPARPAGRLGPEEMLLPAPSLAFFAVFADTVGLEIGEIREFMCRGSLDQGFLDREFGPGSTSENGELLAALHPRDRHARPSVSWVAKMACELSLEITVLCPGGTAGRFQRGHWGFIVQPEGFRGRIVVGTSCLTAWQRVAQPGTRQERFWRVYSGLPVYACVGGRHGRGLVRGRLLNRIRAESERLRSLWPAGREPIAAGEDDGNGEGNARRRRLRYRSGREAEPCAETITLQQLLDADNGPAIRCTIEGQLELQDGAWTPEARIDFGETCSQVLRGIGTRGGQVIVRKTVDVDGYFFLLAMAQAPKVFRDGLKVLFEPQGTRGDRRTTESIRRLLELGGELMGQGGEDFVAVQLGYARTTQGRNDTGVFLVLAGAAATASGVQQAEELLGGAIAHAIRLPCSEEEGHECTGPAVIAHHRSNSTTARGLTRKGGASDIIGPGVIGCFVYHVEQYLARRLAEGSRWQVTLVGRNFDTKKSVVVDAEKEGGLGELVREIRIKLSPSETRVFLIDVAVQGNFEAVFEGEQRREPLFAFWNREAISRMLFSGRCLDCYGQYFTVDMAGYKGPSGLARLGDVKAYSTMFRLLTVGAEKIPISYQGIASQLLRAIPKGVGAVEQVAASTGKRLADEIVKLLQRIEGLEGSASLRLEATVRMEDLGSQVNLMLSQFGRLSPEQVTVLDYELLGRFFAYQLLLVATTLEEKLRQSRETLLQMDAGRVREGLCTIAALESLVTRCFWSGQHVTRIGDLLFNVTSPVSLRLREAEHWIECLEVVLFMRKEEIDASERWRGCRGPH